MVPEPRLTVTEAVFQEVQEPVPGRLTLAILEPLTSSTPLRSLVEPLAKRHVNV